MTKNPLSPKLLDLTNRIVDAIKCEAGDRFKIEAEADPNTTGFDHITVSSEHAYLLISVGRGVIELPLHEIPVSGKNHVKVTAYLKSIPGAPMIPHRLEGTLEQQYDNPETAIEAAFFLYMLNNAESIYSLVAELMKKSVLD